MIENVINNPRVPKAGTIWAWGSTSIPYGWLLCDGSAVSRTTYKALFDAIGTYYGAGDGTTTFNLPNGKIPVANVLAVVGTGMAMGLMGSDSQTAIGFKGGLTGINNVSNAGTVLSAFTGGYGKGAGEPSGASSPLPANVCGFGLTNDPTKSGVVSDISNESFAIIKY